MTLQLLRPFELADQDTITWNPSAYPQATITLGGNRAFAAPVPMVAGDSYLLYVTQDATGSRLLTWDSVFKWPSGTPPTLSTTPGETNIIPFVTDGEAMYGVSTGPAPTPPPPGLAITDVVADTDTSVTLTEITAGDTIVVLTATGDGSDVVSVTDGINTYSNLVSDHGGDGVEIWYCLNPAHVPNGTVLSVNYHGTPTVSYVHVMTLNTTATAGQWGSNTGISATPSVSTIGVVPDVSAVFGVMIGAPTSNALTQSAGWSGAVVGVIGTVSGQAFDVADGYLISSGAGVQSYAPTGWPVPINQQVIFRAVIGSFQ